MLLEGERPPFLFLLVLIDLQMGGKGSHHQGSCATKVHAARYFDLADGKKA